MALSVNRTKSRKFPFEHLLIGAKPSAYISYIGWLDILPGQLLAHAFENRVSL